MTIITTAITTTTATKVPAISLTSGHPVGSGISMHGLPGLVLLVWLGLFSFFYGRRWRHRAFDEGRLYNQPFSIFLGLGAHTLLNNGPVKAKIMRCSIILSKVFSVISIK
jgi:hypothetical protein